MICVSVVETELMTCSGSGENITLFCGCEQLKSSLMPLGLFGIQHTQKNTNSCKAFKEQEYSE